MTMAPTSEPYRADSRRMALAHARPKVVAEFFRRCLDVYRAVRSGELPPVVGRVLFSDCPEPFGLDYHRGLGEAAMTVPRSFRTDEAVDGRVFEVQVPGSGWGEVLLL